MSRDQEKAKELLAKAHQLAVPVIIVDSKVIIGFNQKELEAALAAGPAAENKQ